MRFKFYMSFLVAFLFGGMLTASLKAQNANTYIFATSTGATLDPMAGATQLIGTGVDDAGSALTNIGFTFVYETLNYTQFSVTPDGFLKLGSPAAVDQFTNAITSGTNVPKLFPLWDDVATGTTGAVNYVVTGSAPNRILKVQWFVTIPRNTTGAANGTFQAWLYETSNVIEFRYGTAANPSSASIGINGTTPTNFISITASAGGGTASTTTANDAVNTWPGSGTMYSFTPALPCAGTPVGGTTVATPSSACSGANFTLSVTGATGALNLSYQWESSPNGTTWSNIPGATSQNLTTSQTVATWYRRKITCAGNDAWSTGLQVNIAPPTNCYCTAGATSTSFEKISNVTFNTINNSSSSTAGYENFTAVSTTVTAGASYPVSVSISGGFAEDEVRIWIDYNQDGDFTDANEAVYVSPAWGPGPHTGNIAIPTGATAGPTRMRVRMHDATLTPNTTPCGTSSFGQVEDYTINIFVPPCVITCPANITVNVDPNQCGAVVNYPAPTTSGVCGPVTTVPASGSFFPRGVTTVTATEPGGGICSFTITVLDNQNPTITCPANITMNNTPGQCGAIVNFATPTAADNCPGVIVTSVPASGSLFPTGTTTVTSTATDASGNTATCTFTVTVNDTQNPTITCPANIVQGTDPGQCGAVVNYALPTIADNCLFPGPQSLSQSLSHNVGPTIQIGCQAGGFHTDNSYWRAYNLAAAGLPGPLTINTVTFGIERANAAGTGTTQSATVRVWTSAGPFPGSAMTQVATQTVQIPDQTNTLFTVTLTTPPTVPSNANVVVELFTPDGRGLGNAFFIGSNDQGQTAPGYISAADCGFPAPTTLAAVGFPNMHIILDIGGNVAGPNPLQLISGIASGGTFPVGTTTNTYRVTDVAGNTAQCSFTVTVNDTQAPTINCPTPITVTTAIGSCTSVVNYTVTSSDNCPGVTQALFAGLASGSAFPIGVNNVTWRATDAAGNTTNCTFTVTVIDGQLPVISSQPANVTVCDGQSATFSVTATNVLTYQWQSFNGTTWNNIAGATGSTYTVANANLNNNTNSYRVVLTGLCTVVTSNHAKVNVNRLPTVTVQADPSPVILPGQTTNLIATTNPSGGSYVWMLNGNPVGSGSELHDIGVAGIGTYTVVYTDPNGCVSTSNAIEVTGAPSGNVFVYPNPNRGSFTVRFYNTVNESATVNVYDMKGARVHRQSAATTAPYTGIEINLGSAVPAGVYVVELVNSSGKQVGAQRIVVER